MTTKLNKERCLVAGCWMEYYRGLEILQDPDCKFDMSRLIREKKANMKYLEKKYPWLKGIVKILSSKTTCPIGEYEL